MNQGQRPTIHLNAGDAVQVKLTGVKMKKKYE